MVETDWREILSFSQHELALSDKEKLCESLSWMEADDIELNFSDLKTLFRLAQDILKYKSEQVNNLLGQLDTAQRKSGKGKSKSTFMESPTKSSDDVLETIAHQEEVIKANKEILEQLYADIAELEGKKNRLERERDNLDRDSESSRDALSEMDAIAQLENEVTLKNRHIRKLLGDVKVVEEENTKLKEKVSVLKDKLNEATEIIENMTGQLYSINNENRRLKDIVGRCEESKATLSLEVESLRKELLEKESIRENIYDEVKAKVQHWKNIAKTKKTELESILNENMKLKEDLKVSTHSQQSSPTKTKRLDAHEIKIKELQEKLSEACKEILNSADVIENLIAENEGLKRASDETHDNVSVSENKNESDDGKERTLINKLKRKVKSLTVDLQAAEEMISAREKELTEIASQLQLLKTDEGINALLEGLKSKKRKLKLQDAGIKSLVQEVNSLNKTVEDLQLENETMRQQLNIPANEKISTAGILKRSKYLEHHNAQLIKDLQKLENKLVSVELHNRGLNSKINKLIRHLKSMGLKVDKISEICESSDDNSNDMPDDGGGEASALLNERVRKRSDGYEKNENQAQEVAALAEENEGLRKGLQEILEFLKDNSKTTSGVLALQCPSLETVLHSMEARHAAGWFAPHMRTVMELKAALGGKDALLVALHDARKETYEVMSKLFKETERSQDLEQKLQNIDKASTEIDDKAKENHENINWGEFGSWMSDKDQVIEDFTETSHIEALIKKGNLLYENQLRNGLIYFNMKFKVLFEKMTAIAIQTTDDQNKWLIQEEQYKAEIEKLKAELAQNDEDDRSDISPGIINISNPVHLQRKCAYLEESYKYIRTLHEDLKNEYLEAKKEAMVAASEYETEIQKLILAVATLTDKLRCSISLEMFWKQNEALNDITTKYRNLLQNKASQEIQSVHLFKQLEDNKTEIVNNFSSNLKQDRLNNRKLEKMMSDIEQATMTKQLQLVCRELEDKNKQIENLELKILKLQETQSILIDKTLASSTEEDVNLMKDQLQKLADENNILKEQCQHVESQLDIALVQLQDSQHRQLSCDMEINMLRHQILDLQSVGDNKAIVAKLSSEVLVAHLQASESYKKIERLNMSLKKENKLRAEAEEMLRARQKIFDVYAFRFDAKFRYMFEVMQVLRQQYQGSLPITSIENYINNIEEVARKTHVVDKKINEIENLQFSLMTKHTVCDQILDATKNKYMDDDDTCPHNLQKIVLQASHSREIDHYLKKLKTSEQSREEMSKRYNQLEKTLLLVNQAFAKPLHTVIESKISMVKNGECNLELEDIQSDEESDSRRSQTVTLPKPQVLKPPENNVVIKKMLPDDKADVLIGSPLKTANKLETLEVVNVFVQTSAFESLTKHKLVQTDEDRENSNLKYCIISLEKQVDIKDEELNKAMELLRERTDENFKATSEKNHLESKIQFLSDSLYQKDRTNDVLRVTVDELRKKIDEIKDIYNAKRAQSREAGDNKTLIDAVKQFESDKNAIIAEYQELLSKEREEYAASVNQFQAKVAELKHELERVSGDSTTANADTVKEVSSKYITKISDLEKKCFTLQNELDGTKTEVSTYQSEVERWKNLAAERLTKMEQFNSQLEERHSHEVDSYKAENEHWLSQLNENQREHMELRTRLSEQKAAHVKQIAERDAQIEHLKSVIHGLKTQMMTMQTMISINDPSFDLSAIVEVEEGSDILSNHASGPERLELKYDSSMDLHDTVDELRTSVSSSAIWQEPVIERLRREKQLTSKQNAMLRRQIKALAARERRARLDAQNLKNQVFRISTSGNKVATVETAALHNKIASLQAQLMSARRDTHSTVALWDKWKRSQQAAERWQARYEDKCQEVKKLEGYLALAKSSVSRLEKEKRVLLQRLNEVKSEKVLVVEKQDSERSEKRLELPHIEELEHELLHPEPPVSARALLERVQAQQRRIAALEAADIGNEHLVSAYEKALAEITSLKGQVLKLESTLLEVQIKTPINSKKEQESELEYFKSYCNMLKEENVQLTMRANAMETQPTSAHQHRINDLEQTVLTLRGLVSKLQSDNKTTSSLKRQDSRPNSVRSGPDKSRTQLESYRIEIANLKRSIQDKDLLLERSKEMLQIAAEREDELLRENSSLRRQLHELSKSKYGFSSA